MIREKQGEKHREEKEGEEDGETERTKREGREDGRGGRGKMDLGFGEEGKREAKKGDREGTNLGKRGKLALYYYCA